ncbi:DegT/DnrJ/EryC1/StrS family aminotransferase [Metabacillus halosaccharovorans]|uniref:Aminotransferase class V-fold PLP-dependent enzyme n=1 Tax=Metabacillus halosaccharovorans TaxID=930124 RepID=A0ABT3DED7_9BACI|nr:aminotransferase class V-fold PLP-dependent enzyme [Metabacillus halosaccharovorans]MCV9885434.1 aminotransferase class V-fold PLP-dependent enzyme [Metabacillus halosaccharovorans]
MIPLYKPHMPELPHLYSILKSGALAFGKYGREFESELSDFIGTENLIVTNSYNMAILVTLSTLGIGNGDEVLLSPMACLASTQPLLSVGIKVRWADVDPKTGTLSPDSVRERITSKTKAIIHNHYCGYIGYIDEINEIGQNYGIPVIDDCIEAFGGEYKGRKIGNTGTDVTIFSFNAVRIPNTIDGGAVIFKDKPLYNKSLLLRDCGVDRSCFRDEIGEINPQCDITLVGHSATMSDVNAYIGIQQMKEMTKILEKQRQNAREWGNYLKENFKDVSPINNKGTNPNYWVYGLLSEKKKETILTFRKLGYYASGVHLNNNCYSIFGDKSELSGVSEFYNSFLALPCGWWVDKIC